MMWHTAFCIWLFPYSQRVIKVRMNISLCLGYGKDRTPPLPLLNSPPTPKGPKGNRKVVTGGKHTHTHTRRGMAKKT